ncbi:MAG: tetratricopeptide repeat protein [Deltaproteobacteria bacterium]|nr:tetratricopeptide repeat protein [Deltaproteobacteria bacterium]
MKKTLLFLLIIFSWFLPPAQAEIRTFVHTVRQPFSGSQSPDDAEAAAIHKAKREVLEEAGSYLETLTIVEDGRLTKDQVLALAGGILNTEIVSQKPYTTGEGYGVIVKVRVRVDSSVLEDRVKELISDKTAISQLTIIRKRETELLDKIERLEKVNQELAKKNETQTVKKKKEVLKTDFQQTTKELDAVTLRSQAVKFLWKWRKDRKHSNLTRTIGLLNKAIELDSNDALTYGVRGGTCFQLNQFIKAFQDLDKAIELNPDSAMTYNNRGVVYAKLNQPIKAFQDYNKAIELNPDSALIYNNRGDLYAKLNQPIKAFQDYNKAIELDPGNAMAYNNRGVVYAKLNQHISAIQDYDKSIELNPSNADVYNNRGNEYNDLNQPIRAIQDLDKAIELDPGNESAYNNRGYAYAKLNQYIRAIQDYDKVIELNPGSAKAYNSRGIVHINFRRIYQGCADLKKACNLGECKGLETVRRLGVCQ